MDTIKKTTINSIIGKAMGISLSLYLFLSSYLAVGSFSVGDVIMMSLTFMMILLCGKVRLYKELMVFLGYAFCQTLILVLLSKPYMNLSGYVKRMILMAILYVIATYVSKYCDKHLFFKSYMLLSIACMAGIIYQFIQVEILHAPMTILIPFYEHTIKDLTLLTSSARPSSFFLEPQHFASFVLPLLIIELRRGKMLFSGLISVCIFMSTSTQGIVLVVVIWTMYFLVFSDREKKTKIIGILFVLLFILWGVQTDFFATAIYKYESGSGSNMFRILRAPEVYKAMPLTDKITGIGVKNVNDYLRISGVAPLWLRSELSVSKNFLSSFFGNFVEFGFLGGMIYAWMIARMFKRAGISGKAVSVLLLASSFASTISYNVWFVFYFCIYQFVKDESYVEHWENRKKWIKLVY